MRRGQRGSAAIEFAAVLPLLAVSLLFVAQASLIVWDQLRITHAAREGARELAVTNDADTAVSAALRAGALPEDRAAVTVEPSTRPAGSNGIVRVRFDVPIVLPFLSHWLNAFTLTSEASMRMERDPP